MNWFTVFSIYILLLFPLMVLCLLPTLDMNKFNLDLKPFQYPNPYQDKRKWWCEEHEPPFSCTVYPVQASVLTMKSRRRFQERVDFFLNLFSIPHDIFFGEDKKLIHFEDHFSHMTERYSSFWKKHLPDAGRNRGTSTLDLRGHLSCTLGHHHMLQQMQFFPHLVVEDDVEFVFNFPNRLYSILNALPDDWDILVLGFSSDIQHSEKAKLNDGQPLFIPGFSRIFHFIGGYGYLIRNEQVQQKLLSLMYPMDWHFDIQMAELVEHGHLIAYGAIPNLVIHPGKLRISSFDHNTMGELKYLRSDTNSKKTDPNNIYRNKKW